MKIRTRSVFTLTFAIAFIFSYYSPHTTVSPGNLGRSHQETKSCFDCHEPMGGIPDRKCIACHDFQATGASLTVSASSTRERAGLIHEEEIIGEQRCTKCHNDHKGIDGTMQRNPDYRGFHAGRDIRGNCTRCHTPPENLLHRKFKQQPCEKCHTNDTWRPTPGTAAKFHSAEADCLSCHEKPGDSFHRAVSSRCSSCHGFENWNASIDHDRYFRLGKTHNRGCSKCHKNGYKTYDCFGCHAHSPGNIRHEHVEHGIRHYESCADCHRSSSERAAKDAWRRIKSQGRDASYR